MIVTVASGKGGTGKTTIATSLALAATAWGLLDCDVEAPNAHLFLKPSLDRRKPIYLPIPQVDSTRCEACGRCAEVCQFNAIVMAGRQPLVFPELCHGCGSCMWQCPVAAITETQREIGHIEAGTTDSGLAFATGYLHTGETLAVPIIQSLRKALTPPEGALLIQDAPPGTSCPVVATLANSDYALLVSEPTPFGLHDLRLAVELVRDLGIPAGLVINRDEAGPATQTMLNFCAEQALPVLLRIPFQRDIASALARGETLLQARPQLHDDFVELYRWICQQQRQELAT